MAWIIIGLLAIIASTLLFGAHITLIAAGALLAIEVIRKFGSTIARLVVITAKLVVIATGLSLILALTVALNGGIHWLIDLVFPT